MGAPVEQPSGPAEQPPGPAGQLPATSETAASSTGKTGIVVGVVLLVVAVGLAVPGAIFVAQNFVDQLALSPTMPAPGTRSLELAAGDYDLYEAEGPWVPPPLTLVVTGPTGAGVPVSVPSGAATITRGGTQYAAVAGFDAAVSGVYRLAVQAPPSAAPQRVIVAQSPVSLLRSSLGWAAAAFLGVAVGIAGIVVLIVSILRGDGERSRRARYGSRAEP